MRTFTEYLEQIRPEINTRIKEICESRLQDPDIIPLLLKGKRLRAGLLMLVYEGLSDNTNRHEALDLACAIELAHAASLILDDMLDEDTERRGLPTIHLKKGHKKAMLDTIGVLSLPYDIIAKYGKRYVEGLAQTQRKMVFGATKELLKDPKLPATKIYDIIITHKTGRLFSLAAEWGAMAAQGLLLHKSTRTVFAEYGLRCGNAMQLADDIADLKQIINGKKTKGFGSEMLLLKCIAVDGLIKELIHDIEHHTLDFSKASRKYLNTAAKNQLCHMLNSEICAARKALECANILYIEYDEMLYSAPNDIANIMISE